MHKTTGAVGVLVGEIAQDAVACVGRRKSVERRPQSFTIFLLSGGIRKDEPLVAPQCGQQNVVTHPIQTVARGAPQGGPEQFGRARLVGVPTGVRKQWQWTMQR